MLNRQLRRLFWRGSVCRRWSRVWPEPRVLWEPSWWLSWSSSYDEECSVALGSGLRFSGVYSRVWKNAGPAFPFLSSWAVGPWLVGRLFQGFLYSQQRLLASLPASSLRRAKTTQFPIRLCWFRTMTKPPLLRFQTWQDNKVHNSNARSERDSLLVIALDITWNGVFCCIIILFVRGSLSNEESFKGFEVGKESRRWLPRSCRTDAKKMFVKWPVQIFFGEKSYVGILKSLNILAILWRIWKVKLYMKP